MVWYQYHQPVAGALAKKFARLIGAAKESSYVWPVLRNGRYMIPAHMMSTELAAYLSLPCWYKDDRSGDRDRSLTIPPRREPRMVSATWTSDTQTTISPGTLR